MKRFSTRQYALTLLELLEASTPPERPKLVRGFLQTLARRHQLRVLSRIVSRVETEYWKRHDIVRVQARSAHPLPGTFATTLGKTLKQRVVLDAVADSRLIGGVQIRMGERLVDASIPSFLHSLRQQLTRA